MSACARDYKLAVRDYSAGLGPARSADDAIDRLLLGFLAMTPSDAAPASRHREYQAARQRWPTDVELAWLAFDQCGTDCDHDAEIRHLLSVDPDNAAAWMVAMADAQQKHDEAGFAYALQRAANAKIYDSRMGVVFLHMRSQLARVPVPDTCRTPQELAAMRQNVGREPTDDDLRDLMAQGIEIAIAMPAFSGLSACSSRAGSLSNAQHQQCLGLLARVAQGDTLVEQGIALSVLLKIETNPSRLAQWRERYRQLQWLKSATFGKTIPEHYATRMWSQGEVATMQAIAMQRGLWPPPPDWLPADPRMRALITGADPPKPAPPGHP